MRPAGAVALRSPPRRLGPDQVHEIEDRSVERARRRVIDANVMEEVDWKAARRKNTGARQCSRDVAAVAKKAVGAASLFCW
jgi:hypothetical protein